VVSDGQIVGVKENLSLAVRQSDQLVVELLGQLDGRLADLQLWDRPINSKIIYLLGSLISWRWNSWANWMDGWLIYCYGTDP
jgi:hypothetical protein